MARAFYSVIGSANPTLAQFETAIAALFAPLTANVIKAFDLVLTDKAPASTRFVRAVVDTDTVGAASLTDPYLIKAIQAEDEATAIGDLNTFIATIPGYFVSPVFYAYSDQAAGQPARVILFVAYTPDASGGEVNWQVSGGSGSGSVPLYTNATPMPEAVGGYDAGTTFLGQTYQQMWDGLLYVYQSPTFSAFSISGQALSLEVGDSIAQNVTFVWTTTNAANIAANSIDINDVTLATNLASGLANDGSEAIVQASPITNVVAATHQYEIEATDTNSNVFSRTVTYTWKWRTFYGFSANVTLTEAQIEALASSVLATAIAGTYAMGATGYKYICVSDAIGGQINSVKDSLTLLDVPMATVADNAAYSNVDGGGTSYALVSVTNGFGVTHNYRIYRTVNSLGSAITLIVA